MGTPSMGWASKCSVAGTVMEYQSESMAKRGSIIDGSGMRGLRSRGHERLRDGTYTAGGTIVLQPCPQELAVILPLVMGAAGSAGVFALGDTFNDFTTIINKVARVHSYTGCRINRMTLRGSEGTPIECALDIEAKVETTASAPSGDAMLYPPFVFMDGVFTLESTERPCRQFELVVDNVLQTGRFMNKITRDYMVPTDRVVSLSLVLPYTSDELDLYDLGADGMSGELEFAFGSYSFLAEFGKLCTPTETPVFASKTDEGFMSLNLMARKLGATMGTTDEIKITLDSTP